MKKFTYWFIECLDDSQCYAIAERTKKEAIERFKQTYHRLGYGELSTVKVEKKVLEYDDTHDLFEWVCGEAGGKDCGETVKFYKYRSASQLLD